MYVALVQKQRENKGLFSKSDVKWQLVLVTNFRQDNTLSAVNLDIAKINLEVKGEGLKFILSKEVSGRPLYHELPSVDQFLQLTLYHNASLSFFFVSTQCTHMYV